MSAALLYKVVHASIMAIATLHQIARVANMDTIWLLHLVLLLVIATHVPTYQIVKPVMIQTQVVVSCARRVIM